MTENIWIKRLPVLTSFVLFLALCAALTYWLLQWFAPVPRAVAALPRSEQSMPPIAAAANLFGGHAEGNAVSNVQLRGIVRSGGATGSRAIIAAEGHPARVMALEAEIMPGMTIKEIHERSVVLTDHGAERELSLPPFAAQEGAAISAQLRPPPLDATQVTPQQIQQQLQQTAPQASQQPAQGAQGATGATGSGAVGASGTASPTSGASSAGHRP